MSFVCGRILSICIRMTFLCQPYILVYHLHVTRMYLYVMVYHSYCTRMSCVCHSYVLVCHPNVTRMYSYVILYTCYVFIRMSSVCDWYILVCHLYITRISSVCHSYILLCHLYVTRMWFYYVSNDIVKCKITTTLASFITCKNFQT